jgi:hypothetical protein
MVQIKFISNSETLELENWSKYVHEIKCKLGNKIEKLMQIKE